MKRILSLLGFAGVVLLASSASAETVSGFNYGTIHPAYNAPGLPLLGSFYFRFTGDDHHIRHLSVMPEPSQGTIMLAFHDANWDDEYYYTVEHRRQTATTEIVTGSHSDICKGSCTKPISKPAGDYVFVLRGFRMFYQGDDHHIDEIGIVEDNGNLSAFMNDKNNDDNIVWYADYAWVPRSFFSTVSRVSGEVTDGGTARVTIPAGTAVIRGWKFNYVHSDHHIKELGVMTKPGAIEVYYGDENGDDDMRYAVRYGILK